MSRSKRQAPTDGVLVAQLCGTALRLARSGGDERTAAAELRAITDRADLLSRAAGVELGSARYDAVIHHGAAAAGALLLAAGADPDVAEREAQIVLERLQSRHPPRHP